MDAETMKMILDAVVALVSVLISAVLIPYIKSKVDAEKLAKIEEYASTAIRCAEQIFTPEEWLEKKEYVTSYVARKAQDIGIDMTSEDVELLVEGFVHLIKKE